jgi:hypothetical protein
MPKMTRWDSPEPIDVASEKAAVYAAQGWMAVNAPVKKVQPAVVREPVVLEVEVEVEAEPAAEQPKAPAKKAAAKKAAKK